jgi:prepilin-type N-terminal cleavage/methylation domain-containing protein
MDSAGRRRRQQGVTLVELVVTMAIAVILLTVGASGMSQLYKRNARAGEVNALVGNLNYARGEAVLRGTPVVVCPIDPDSLPAEPAKPCAKIKAPDGDWQWHQGYVIYVDDDEKCAEAGSCERLRIQPPSKGVTIESSGGRSQLQFDDDGSSDNVTLRVCDANDDADSDEDRAGSVAPPRAVIVSRVGRVRVSEKVGDDDISCSGEAPPGG